MMKRLIDRLAYIIDNNITYVLFMTIIIISSVALTHLMFRDLELESKELQSYEEIIQRCERIIQRCDELNQKLNEMKRKELFDWYTIDLGISSNIRSGTDIFNIHKSKIYPSTAELFNLEGN